MDKHSDLLPWILGGLSIATVAIGLAVGSMRTHSQTTVGAAPASAPTPSVVPAHASAPFLQAAQTAQAVAVPPTVVPQMQQIAAPAMESSDKVWECTINGQKSFSDTPCGGNSIVRDIGPINRMDSAPILPLTRSYAPEPSYQPDDTYPNATDGEQAGDSEQQPVDNSYPVYIAVPSRGHRRPNHAHRPHNHDHGPRVQTQ
ncbi:MAG TPA: hypothetical protein VIJ37_05340 [Steroidobacteraceae bacterium]